MSKNIALVTKKPQSLITNEKTSTPHVTKNQGLFQVILSSIGVFDQNLLHVTSSGYFTAIIGDFSHFVKNMRNFCSVPLEQLGNIVHARKCWLLNILWNHLSILG